MPIDDLDQFEAEIEELVQSLQQVFKSGKSRWFLHEQSETLYVELEGLETYDEQQVEGLASTILDETELDFEEIILLPYFR